MDFVYNPVLFIETRSLRTPVFRTHLVPVASVQQGSAAVVMSLELNTRWWQLRETSYGVVEGS